MEQQQNIKEGELPQVTNWDGATLFQYQGFWLGSLPVSTMIPFQKHFQAQEGDVVLATFPKSGTTWLKALAFSIINRTHYSPSDHIAHPLLASNSHDLVHFFELQLYRNNLNPSAPPPLDPRQLHGRIFATHLPLSLLAPSIIKDTTSKCRVINLCRNPLDLFISTYKIFVKTSVLRNLRHYTDEHDHEVVDLDDTSELFEHAFDLFCRGIARYGPSLDHALEYWKMSKENPDKVLFLMYEDLKEDTAAHIKRMAEFLGCPFSQEEETKGVIDDIVTLCSFETMTDLDVNKTGKHGLGFDNSCFFRKGEVGDWANYLTPAMVEHVQKLVQEKLAGSGLTFNFFNKV